MNSRWKGSETGAPEFLGSFCPSDIVILLEINSDGSDIRRHRKQLLQQSQINSHLEYIYISHTFPQAFGCLP
jgi:hypothetical protein